MFLIKPNELYWYYSRKIIILVLVLLANVGICINAHFPNWRVATFCLFVVRVTPGTDYVTKRQCGMSIILLFLWSRKPEYFDEIQLALYI